MKNIKRVLIVGGGATGWMAAAYLEKHVPDLEITLIESDRIPPLPVGEATTPVTVAFLKDLGLDEREWMPLAHATYKIGNMKQGWEKKDGDPFLMSFWFDGNKQTDEFIAEFRQGKKTRDQVNDQFYRFAHDHSYAYHLDATKIGLVVKKACKNVTAIVDTLPGTLPEGYDLYINCAGLNSPFSIDKTRTKLEHHIVNSTWVCPIEYNDQVPYPGVKGICTYTQTIARNYGWQFIVPLMNRMGTGYVYSDKFVSDADALIEFESMISKHKKFNGTKPMNLKWEVGYLTNPWTDNVVSIGLAHGFIDPLEAPGLLLTQHCIKTLAHCIKEKKPSKFYNRAINKTLYDLSTFTLHHYMLSERDDTEFWRYYKKFDVKKSLWEHYNSKSKISSNVYPSPIWASLGLYFNEFTHYDR
jgi:tryptophan 7-halogenase